MRFCACLGLHLHIIEPCGFVLDDRKLKRVAMDYASDVSFTRHTNFDAFIDFKQRQANAKLIILSTKAPTAYTKVNYNKGDFLLLGRESSGVPQDVYEQCDEHATIPMHAGARSLNVVIAASMVAGEALRQIVIKNTTNAAWFIAVWQVKIFIAPLFEFCMIVWVMCVAGLLEGGMKIRRVIIIGDHGSEVGSATKPGFRFYILAFGSRLLLSLWVGYWCIAGHDHAGVHMYRGH